MTFLILLELMKTQKVHIVQDSIGGTILVEAGALENAGTGPEDAPAPIDAPEDGGDMPPEDDAPVPMDSPEDGSDVPVDAPRDSFGAFENTSGEVSSAGMPLTAFHRMEIVTSVFTPECLMPESAHESHSKAEISSGSPKRIGLAIPSFISLSAARIVRSSLPSGKTIVFTSDFALAITLSIILIWFTPLSSDYL